MIRYWSDFTPEQRMNIKVNMPPFLALIGLIVYGIIGTFIPDLRYFEMFVALMSSVLFLGVFGLIRKHLWNKKHIDLKDGDMF